MKRIQLPLLTISTAVVLILTLLGFMATGGVLAAIQWILVSWAVIIAAFAIVLGVVNILAVHIAKLSTRAPGWPYSLALILSAVGVLAIGLGELFFQPGQGLWGPVLSQIFVGVLVPLEAAAAALLPFILTFAAYRMLRSPQPRGAWLFLLSALIVLLTLLPIKGLMVERQGLRAIWLSWLATPGLRALLIGVALGITMAALRLMMGIDRPQT